MILKLQGAETVSALSISVSLFQAHRALHVINTKDLLRKTIYF